MSASGRAATRARMGETGGGALRVARRGGVSSMVRAILMHASTEKRTARADPRVDGVGEAAEANFAGLLQQQLAAIVPIRHHVPKRDLVHVHRDGQAAQVGEGVTLLEREELDREQPGREALQ